VVDSVGYLINESTTPARKTSFQNTASYSVRATPPSKGGETFLILHLLILIIDHLITSLFTGTRTNDRGKENIEISLQQEE
jgi:hypothetical protein